MKTCRHHTNAPEWGCARCQPYYEAAVAALTQHGLAPPTAATRKLALFVLQYTADDYASGANGPEHRQVLAAMQRGARWFAHHEHGGR